MPAPVFRSQVISGDEEVRISVTTSGQTQCLLWTDRSGIGCPQTTRCGGKEIPLVSEICPISGHSFYRILREKLRERPRYQTDSDGDDP